MECDFLNLLSFFIKVSTINDVNNHLNFAVVVLLLSVFPMPFLPPNPHSQAATKDITSHRSLEQDGTEVESVAKS